MFASKLLLVLPIYLAIISADIYINAKTAYTVCPGKRIWNLSGPALANEIKKLQNCNIIEGFLDIRDVSLNSSISFPKLLQVTDYVVLYYVEGVNSVAKLFPLLSVIRGNRIFHEYALVLINNYDLREIGPWSLKSIIRGSIRMESNILMCINSRAELENITLDKNSRNRIAIYKNFDLCPFEDCEEEKWCTALAKACTDIGCYTDSKCHEECLGGCRGNNSTCCAACKNFLLENKCVSECPNSYIMYMNYRCISKAECLDYGWAIKIQNDADLGENSLEENKSNKFAGSECVPKCPTGYVKRNSSGICEQRKAEDWCEGANLTNGNLGSELKGCSIIRGNLIVMVTGGKNVTLQLEANLGNLENITGYLRVVGANALLSLNFLRNLKYIGGNDVAHDGCVLCVFENSNLEELWNWETKKSNLTVNGVAFIAFNNHLCPAEVNKLFERSNLLANNSVNQSNGIKGSCEIVFSPLIAIAGNVPGTVNLSFYHIWCGVNSETFAGYNVYYRATNENVTLYDQRDICSNAIWKTIYFHSESPLGEGECLSDYSLENLEPNTRYAIYAKSVSTDFNAVHTDIVYVTTYPVRPPASQNGKLSFSGKELIISVDETINPRDGGFYEVSVDLRTEVADKSLRSYGSCQEDSKVLTTTPTLTSTEIALSVESFNESDSTCNCLPFDVDSEILRRKETTIAVDNIINRLYHQVEKFKRGNRDDTKKLHPTMKNVTSQNSSNETPQNTNSYMCYDKVAAPKGYCGSPVLNWTNKEDAYIRFSELAIESNWTGYESESHFVIQSSKNELSLILPSNIRMPARIEVKVRACLGMMSPCPPLNSSSSCALCSDYYKNVIYKEVPLPPVENFKIIPRTIDQAGKQLDIAYTKIDCESRVVDMTNDVSTNRLKLDISWDHSDGDGNLVRGYKIQYSSLDLKETSSICLSKLSADERENKIELDVSPSKKYKVAILINSTNGFQLSKEICLQIRDSGKYDDVYWIGAAAVLTAVLVVFMLIYRSVLNKNFLVRGEIKITHNKYCKDRPLDCIPEKLQIAAERIQINEEDVRSPLGEGNFGIVIQGVLTEYEQRSELFEVVHSTGKQKFVSLYKRIIRSLKLRKSSQKIEVAVKTIVKPDDEGKRFKMIVEEARQAMKFNNEFVIKFFGIYHNPNFSDDLHLVFELMDTNLRKYLREEDINVELMTEIAVQIADGMAYIGALKCVHRDLASRNVLISHRSDPAMPKLAKIADFGLTRSLDEGDYVIIHKDGDEPRRLPIRWMAPECDSMSCYNTRTDVWAFGVLLWEIMNRGEKPYQHISSEDDVGYLLKHDLSKLCLKEIQETNENKFLLNMMKGCMKWHPLDRPKFKDMVGILIQRCPQDFKEKFTKVSYSLNSIYCDTDSTEGIDEGLPDNSLNASQDEDDPATTSLSTSYQHCDDTSYSSLTQEEGSSKTMSCLSLKCVTSASLPFSGRRFSVSENKLGSQ